MNKNKRIYFLVTNDLRQDQRMHRICASLTESGVNCILIGRKHADSPSFATDKFQFKRLNCFFKTGFKFYLEYNIRLFFLLATARFDAICAIDLDTILPAAIAASLRRKLLIHDAHEFFIESIEIIHRPVVRKIWTWIGKKMVPRADYCYTVNESLAIKLSEIYNQEFEVIRNVPMIKDLEVENLVHEERIPVILYQGVLNEGRGLRLLLECMSELKAELWIVGEGVLKSSLISIAEELGVSEKVQFKGFISGDDLHQITKKASIGVNVLSPASGNYQYSLANKTFDYIHALVPAIHMDFPEYKRINEQYEVSILIHEYTKDALLYAIQYLLSNTDAYLRLKDNCYKARQDYHWKNESQKLIEFYAQWLN